MHAKERDQLAIRLNVAIKRLHARLKEAAPDGVARLTVSQLAILKRLRDGGPATAALLASAEHVSQQAMAQSLAGLRRAGLVHSRPDPADGRKNLVSMTHVGNDLFEAAVASRQGWVARTIDATLSDKEIPDLERAITLMERLAAADTPPVAPAPTPDIERK